MLVSGTVQCSTPGGKKVDALRLAPTPLFHLSLLTSRTRAVCRASAMNSDLDEFSVGIHGLLSRQLSNAPPYVHHNLKFKLALYPMLILLLPQGRTSYRRT